MNWIMQKRDKNVLTSEDFEQQRCINDGFDDNNCYLHDLSEEDFELQSFNKDTFVRLKPSAIEFSHTKRNKIKNNYEVKNNCGVLSPVYSNKNTEELMFSSSSESDKEEDFSERLKRECEEFIKNSLPKQEDLIKLLMSLTTKRRKDQTDSKVINLNNAQIKLQFDGTMTKAESESFLANKNRRRNAINCNEPSHLLNMLKQYYVGRTLWYCKLL